MPWQAMLIIDILIGIAAGIVTANRLNSKQSARRQSGIILAAATVTGWIVGTVNLLDPVLSGGVGAILGFIAGVAILVSSFVLRVLPLGGDRGDGVGHCEEENGSQKPAAVPQPGISAGER